MPCYYNYCGAHCAGVCYPGTRAKPPLARTRVKAEPAVRENNERYAYYQDDWGVWHKTDQHRSLDAWG